MESKSVELVYTERINLTLRAKFLLSIFCRLAKNKRTLVNFDWMYSGENSMAFAELLNAKLVMQVALGRDTYRLSEKGKYFLDLHSCRIPVFESMIPENFFDEQQAKS